MVTGKIIEVDLGTGTVQRSDHGPVAIEATLAGRGFSVDYLYWHLAGDADPLGTENILIFSCGLLTGSAAPAASRMHVNAISPLTGLLGSSNVGGDVGAGIRALGIQSVIIRGRAPHPVCLYLHRGGVDLVDARRLWDLDAFQTQEQLPGLLTEERLKALAIGPAGENQVPFACVMAGKDHAAGRTGMGAVMGAKNLKALAVGTAGRPSRPKLDQNARQAIDTYVRQVKASPAFQTFLRYGGAGFVKWADEQGILPTRNFQQTRFEGAAQLDGTRLASSRVRSRGCHRCPIQCKAALRFEGGRFDGYRGERPEFESILSLGAKCGLKDPQAIVVLDNLCSRLGLDAISAASVIAFAMDLYERGILTRRDTGGLALQWGDAAVMEQLLKEIAHRQGFGAVLSGGVRHAAQQIGRGAEAFAPHVKGLELASYHPAALWGTALGYAVSPRGGDYVYASMECSWSPERARQEFGTPLAVDGRAADGKALLVKRAVLVNIVLDSLGLCRVPALTCIGAFDLCLEAWLAATLTGLPFTPASLFAAGKRVAAMERLINLRLGLRPAQDDRLPPMFNNTSDVGIDPALFEKMRQEYYACMGWGEDGHPLPQTLERLGLLPTA